MPKNASKMPENTGKYAPGVLNPSEKYRKMPRKCLENAEKYASGVLNPPENACRISRNLIRNARTPELLRSRAHPHARNKQNAPELLRSRAGARDICMQMSSDLVK